MTNRLSRMADDRWYMPRRATARDATTKSALARVLLLACIALVPGTVLAESTFEPNVDYPKFDYRSFEFTRPRPRLCQAACINDPRCRVWTFVRPGVLGQLASCWLKEDITIPRSNQCCVSGVK